MEFTFLFIAFEIYFVAFDCYGSTSSRFMMNLYHLCLLPSFMRWLVSSVMFLVDLHAPLRRYAFHQFLTHRHRNVITVPGVSFSLVTFLDTIR